MIGKDITLKLVHSFPRSFINGGLEFIAHKKANEYFRLEDCENELDVKCKVLERFSRGAFKTEPFYSVYENDRLHEFMLNGINKYLGANFSYDDIEIIYTYLGNCRDHQKTILFIESGYDMAILKDRDGREK
jgi:hypothetical protein